MPRNDKYVVNTGQLRWFILSKLLLCDVELSSGTVISVLRMWKHVHETMINSVNPTDGRWDVLVKQPYIA